MIVHPISNLNLRFHEFTDPTDEVIPDGTDLVVFCGGISNRLKRSLLYCETLAEKYPNVDFILNTSPIEYHTEVPDILDSAMRVRYENLQFSNLYYSQDAFDYKDYDVLTLVGWPKVSQIPERLSKIFGEPAPKYLSDGECVNKNFRYFISLAEMNAMHEIEYSKLVNWLAHDSGKQKILITGTAPVGDPYSTDYTLYGDLDLSGVTWIHGGSEYSDANQNAIRLICNPGRGDPRARTFII